MCCCSTSPLTTLDIDTLRQLEDLLDSWPGTLVVVSHDRYLIERICDRVVALFGDGSISELVGGIDEYLARRHNALGSAPQVTSTDPRNAPSAPQSPTADSPAGLSSAEHRAARKELAKLERRLDTLHRQKNQLHVALAAATTTPDRLLALDGRAADATRRRVHSGGTMARRF